LVRILLSAALIVIAATGAAADSVFDQAGAGKDVIPAIGILRPSAGAAVASNDPASATIISPFGAALAERIVVSGGYVHSNTSSKSMGEEKSTITSLFPSVAVTIPVKGVSFLTGIFIEKEGRITLSETGTYQETPYTETLRREVSAHSVPAYVTASVADRVILSGGLIFSFLNVRERTEVSYGSDAYSDTRDVADISVMGTGFAGGALVDLGMIRLAGQFRTKTDMDGTLDRENRTAGIWHSRGLTVSSVESYGAGIAFEPTDAFLAEFDYYKSPWSELQLDGALITNRKVERLSVAVHYRGDHFWRASRFPLIAGYYAQPLDWETPQTGKMTERFFCIGTSIPVVRDRARVSVSIETGRREAENATDLEETIYRFSLAVSASEVWRREIEKE
jgi:hypothetical protein